MKLYYLPGACSLAAHILLREAGADFSLSKVDPATGRTAEGEDYRTINPLGYVPALAVPGQGVMLENGAILPWLAERFGFAGEGGRAPMLEEIAFLSSELHKAYSPFFRQPEPAGEARREAERHLRTRLGRYEEAYAAPTFDAAKVYAFVITGWSPHAGIALDAYPAILAMRQALAERPSVRAAMAAEGLL